MWTAAHWSLVSPNSRQSAQSATRHSGMIYKIRLVSTMHKPDNNAINEMERYIEQSFCFPFAIIKLNGATRIFSK